MMVVWLEREKDENRTITKFLMALPVGTKFSIQAETHVWQTTEDGYCYADCPTNDFFHYKWEGRLSSIFEGYQWVRIHHD